MPPILLGALISATSPVQVRRCHPRLRPPPRPPGTTPNEHRRSLVSTPHPTHLHTQNNARDHLERARISPSTRTYKALAHESLMCLCLSDCLLHRVVPGLVALPFRIVHVACQNTVLPTVALSRGCKVSSKSCACASSSCPAPAASSADPRRSAGALRAITAACHISCGSHRGSRPCRFALRPALLS